MPELVAHSDAASDVGGDRGTGHAEFGKGTPAENEKRSQDNIEAVGDPECAHGKHGITRAAENRVDDENHEHGDVAAHHDAREARALGHEAFRTAHQAEKLRSERAQDGANGHGHEEAQQEDLTRGVSGAFGIFFACPPRDDRHGGDGDADRHRVDQRHDRFRQPDDGDGVAAQA